MSGHHTEREEEGPGRGFTRGGFAPIPHRHRDLPPLRPEPDRMDARGPAAPDMRDPAYRRDDFPVDREREPRTEREDWDRRGSARRTGPGPAWDDDYDRPKRRRSPSPHSSSYRQRLYSPSPPPGGRTSGPVPDMRHPHASALPDPATLQYQLTFRQFVDWFRMSHPQTAKADEEELRRYKASVEEGAADPSVSKDKVGIGKRYDRYRKEYTSRQLFALFLSHKPSPWFQERYSADPQFVAMRKRVNRQGRVPTVEKYIDALRAGRFDDVVFEHTDDKSKGSHGGRRPSELEEPDGLDRALGEAAGFGPDSDRIDIPPNTSQVFVKTVPPTISRKELETLFSTAEGFQYIALSEPSAKKGFHRVAWAQFADGIDTEAVVKKLDGSRIDNFTLHMGVNATATSGRLRITHPQANEFDQLVADGQRAKSLAVKLEDELLDSDDGAQAESAAPPEGIGGENAMSGTTTKGPTLRERGSDLVEERIMRLLESKGLLESDLNPELSLQKAKLTVDHWISYLRHGLSTCYYCVAPTSFPEELERKCVAHVRPTMQDTQNNGTHSPGGELPGANEKPDTEDSADAAMPAVQGAVHEDKEDEDNRESGDRAEDREAAGGDEVRGRVESKRDRNSSRFHEERWAETLDHKIRPLLEEVDVTEYGGRDPDAEAKRLTAPLIKQEEANKYRCKECSKLFKAPEFVIKHVTLKHGEVVKPKLDDVAMLNNFVLDPQHLPVMAQTPAAVNEQLPIPATALVNPAAIFNPAFVGQTGANGGPAGSGANIMQQQMMMMMQMQQAMMMQMAGGAAGGQRGGPQGSGRGLQERVGGYADLPRSNEPLPPPPPGGEDPRARRGRVSYQDLDAVGGGGDGGLPY